MMTWEGERESKRAGNFRRLNFYFVKSQQLAEYNRDEIEEQNDNKFSREERDFILKRFSVENIEK